MSEERKKEFICPYYNSIYGVAEQCCVIKNLISEVVEVLGWMVEDNKYRFDDQRQNLEPGSKGGYSPELTKAIELLEKLKDE